MKVLSLLSLMLCGLASAATYYVSPDGEDTHTGASEKEAIKTVQVAVDRMHAGDTLVLLDGVYTGTLTMKSEITLKAKNPRKVIFSGAEPLTGEFQRHEGNIFKMAIGFDPKQVFYKNVPMTWARWPNMQWAENWDASKKWVKSANDSGPGKLTCEAFADMKGLDLVGGYCFLRYSKGNSCYSRPIKSFDGETLVWDDSDFYSVFFTSEDGRRGSPAAISKGKSKPNVRAKFFLAGALDLLDSEGEWFAKDGTLYFYAPSGVKPNPSDVLVKTADYSILNDDALKDVRISGIDFFATSVKLENSKNQKIIFDDARFTYIGAELLFLNNPVGIRNAKPIYVEGTMIGFNQCLFAGGQNSGLKLNGSDLIVQNSVFAENNRHANFQSVALDIDAKGTFKVTQNTFFNNCSDAIRLGFFDEADTRGREPDISYNNICNAGIFNSDVSGVYMPNLSQHWTSFHHNWVHNVKGNGVRLDQAGEKLTVHHNVFWSSKRGMNIEGFGNFNIYNNTSVMNHEPCMLTRNVVSKRKGTGDAVVSNDTSFPPIEDWNVLNNLVSKFVDRIGPSEDGPYTQSKNEGKLHPERAKNKSLAVVDRGALQANLTGFKNSIFKNGNLDGLDLVPVDKVVQNGATSTAKLEAQHVKGLDSFRGAYDYNSEAWSTGSDWMPDGITVPTTMAQSERFAKEFKGKSYVPNSTIGTLPRGLLSTERFRAEEITEVPSRKKKK
ncbi:right-handed parallel beta-helix repeat-containing protein [Rubritalea spongiae]|uniref:Right-handed parallel beta-helix repeat-containing protein n=1 Tax=Rubritalea spongiae TaxID=430797 RepID=A0ABW5E483_9BACT